LPFFNKEEISLEAYTTTKEDRKKNKNMTRMPTDGAI